MACHRLRHKRRGAAAACQVTIGRAWPSTSHHASGALRRLSNGDMGIGFAEKLNGVFLIVSLASGQKVDSYELVFDRWSLSLRRGAATALVGQFRLPGWRS